MTVIYMLCNITVHDMLAVGATRTDFAVGIGERSIRYGLDGVHTRTEIIAHQLINETKKRPATKEEKKTEQNQ